MPRSGWFAAGTFSSTARIGSYFTCFSIRPTIVARRMRCSRRRLWHRLNWMSFFWLGICRSEAAIFNRWVGNLTAFGPDTLSFQAQRGCRCADNVERVWRGSRKPSALRSAQGSETRDFRKARLSAGLVPFRWPIGSVVDEGLKIFFCDPPVAAKLHSAQAFVVNPSPDGAFLHLKQICDLMEGQHRLAKHGYLSHSFASNESAFISLLMFV